MGGVAVRTYEGLFVIDPTLTDEEFERAVGEIEDLIKRMDGEVEPVERWGRKSLAYQVRKKKEGLFVLVNFKVGPERVSELRRGYRLMERLIRHTVHTRPAKAVLQEEPAQAAE